MPSESTTGLHGVANKIRLRSLNLLRIPPYLDRQTDILINFDVLLSFWACQSDTAALKIKVELKEPYCIRLLPAEISEIEVKKIGDFNALGRHLLSSCLPTESSKSNAIK